MKKKTTIWIIIATLSLAVLICAYFLFAKSTGISQVFGNRVGVQYSYFVHNTHPDKYTSKVIIDGIGVYDIEAPSGWSYSTTEIPGKVVWTADTEADRIPNNGIFYGGFKYKAPQEEPFGYFQTKGDEVPTPTILLGEGGVVTGIPVELSSFEASLSDGSVVLTWTTQSETENLGFHIYRSEEEPGAYCQINQKLIPGAGNSDYQNHYTFSDVNVESGQTYYYRLVDVDFSGQATFHEPLSITVSGLPTDYVLEQNYPNPFNSQTRINFNIAESGSVTLEIYNSTGQLVRTLLSEFREPGPYVLTWDGRDNAGQPVASGLYILKMEVNNFFDVKRMSFMK